MIINELKQFANSVNLPNTGFPNHVDDYYNFEFGRDLCRLYRIYTTEFHQHGLSPRLLDLDGPTIFSHTYGPLLFNHDFDSLYNDDGIGSIVTSSISDIKELKSGVLPFNSTSSFVAENAENMILEKPEFVFSALVKGVDLIHTSGAKGDEESSFSVFRVSKDAQKAGDDPYMFNRTFILSKSTVGAFPRVRMDISKSNLWDEGTYDLNNNFLLPDHDYEISLDALIADRTGRNLGGRSIGLWIHTKPEGTNMWSFVPGRGWIQHSTTITRAQLTGQYGHIFTFPTSVKPVNNPERAEFKCLDVVTQEIKSPVTKLRQEDFRNYTVQFNTRNREIIEPREYKITYGDLHRKDQNYVVEIFMLPGDAESFMLFDSVSIKDLTMKRLSEKFLLGPRTDPLRELKAPQYKGTEFRNEVSKENLLAIFKFFNKLSGKGETVSETSRDDTKTSTIMGTHGGSRITYRYKTTWFNPSFQNGTLNEIKIYEGGVDEGVN